MKVHKLYQLRDVMHIKILDLILLTELVCANGNPFFTPERLPKNSLRLIRGIGIRKLIATVIT